MDLNQDLTLVTNRLTLITVREEYIDEINISFTKKITEFMPFNPAGDRTEITKFVENSKKNLLEKKEVVFVVLNSEKEFIGCCGIHNINHESVEIGLWLKEDFQSKGLGTEITNCLINYIEEKFKINYITYPVDKNNIRSRRIPEKLGFEQYRTYKKHKDELTYLNIIEYRKYYCS